jgi:hypothetical protein
MQFNLTSIILAILVLLSGSFALITLFTFIYFGFTKEKDRVKPGKIFLGTGIAAVAWVASTLLTIMVAASYGLLAFSLVSLLLLFGINYLMVGKTLGINGKEKLFYSLLTAVIFNASWLSVFKLI